MDILGNLKEKQEALQKQLEGIEIVKESADKSIQVTLSGTCEVRDIQIRPVGEMDMERIEDHLILVLNEAIKEAKSQEANLGAASLQDMLPPGLGNLFG